MEELSQHILDIAFNSLEAGATRLEINVRENLLVNILEFEVRDNGRGIAESDLPKVLDPFYTTKKNKRAGLGIPLLKEAAERCGGLFDVISPPEGGTIVRALFPHDHIDRAPMGDIAGTLNVILTAGQSLHMVYRHQYNNNTFCFDTKDIQSHLGDIPVWTPEVLVWLEEYLKNNIALLKEAGESEKLGRTG
ncbi:MAG: ATP-binding protein [Bacillota bacterium]